TDANGLETRIEYDDLLLRQTKVSNYYQNQPVGAATETEYGAPDSTGRIPASQRFVKVKTQIDETNWKTGYTWLDGLGRVIKLQEIDPKGDIFVETEYDQMGRAKKVSNPYRPGETKLWTETTFDAAGRVWKVTTPDAAVTETTYGLATTGNQIGTVVTVKDQSDRQRRSITNAIGKLIRIDEETAAGLGAIDSPNQPTLYDYDTLDNLSTVTQGSQTRAFVYDSMYRLKSVTNPESGTIAYEYDHNGKMTQRTDARGVVTTCTYDALNRVKTRSFSGETGYQTPMVSYIYDNVANAKGKLIKVITGETQNPLSITELAEFNNLGRITKSRQTTDGTTYNEIRYSYNLSGAMVEQVYPSGRVVKNVLDNSGDLSIVQSKKNSNAGFWSYARHFTYETSGALSSMQLGNGRWESVQYNSRLQPTQIALGAVRNATDLLKLNYEYGNWENGAINTQKNNGTLARHTITVPSIGQTQGFVATQTFQHDSLNRLTYAQETISGNQTWQQTFTYDRYGNRNFDEANTTTLPKNCQNGDNPVVCAGDRQVLNPAVSPANNRIISDQDGDNQAEFQFDSSGNNTRDPQNRTFIYDGENKLVEVKNSGNQTVGRYFYDGDGRRVKKYVPATQEITIFVYDIFGKMLAEYSTTPPSSAKLLYLTKDKLGTPRVNTDEKGTIAARHDFMPFGEEITRQNYGSDTVRRKFTTYERDAEIDLDFAQARFYNANLGRFTSPDHVLNDADEATPQSWNLYIYTRNNPLTYTDPTGKEIWIYYEEEVIDDKGNKIKITRRVQYTVDKDGNTVLLNPDGSKYTGDNVTVAKIAAHIDKLRSKSRFAGEIMRLVNNKNQHRISAGKYDNKNVKGGTTWTENSEGVNTDSYYDPDTGEGENGGEPFVTLARELAAAYSATYLKPEPVGPHYEQYFENYNTGSGCCAWMSDHQAYQLNIEQQTREDFGLPKRTTFNGAGIPNLDTKTNLDPRGIEASPSKEEEIGEPPPLPRPTNRRP
ncbi:MAG: hypothetical protein M3384_10810, partial [Acidobacteriota bacterium]|nr:hypothetical protein [Acidobacteriota bacterium]